MLLQASKTCVYLANAEMHATEIKQVHGGNGVINRRRRLILYVAVTSANT